VVDWSGNKNLTGFLDAVVQAGLFANLRIGLASLFLSLSAFLSLFLSAFLSLFLSAGPSSLLVCSSADLFFFFLFLILSFSRPYVCAESDPSSSVMIGDLSSLGCSPHC